VLLIRTSNDSPPATANQIADHPITQHITFPTVKGAAIPPGWSSLVNNGNTTLVAVRDGPPRQVHVCINDPAWAATPDYVIFWTNVFDWLGSAPREQRPHRPEPTHPAPSNAPHGIDLTPAACLGGMLLLIAALFMWNRR
jgi:hypothetical protein